MNADQYLFLVDLNERRGHNTKLVWSIFIQVIKNQTEQVHVLANLISSLFFNVAFVVDHDHFTTVGKQSYVLFV